MLPFSIEMGVAKINLKSLHKIQESIPADAIMHFGISYVIMGLLFLLLNLSLPVSVVIAALIGIGKEYLVDDVADMSDLKADACGIVLFVLCAI